MKTLVLVFALALGAVPLSAQSLPLHRPLSPIAASRSGLALQPYVSFSPYGQRLAATFEYGNAIEYDLPLGVPSTYLLDAELMRTSLAYTRELSPLAFVTIQGEVVGSYDGFADGFFTWYHDLIGFEQPERAARPQNEYASELELPDGRALRPDRTPLALGDLRTTIGFRHSQTQQTALVTTLPTATASGFGRGTVSLSAIHTLRLEPVRRVIFEGTLGVGATPRHGELAEYQRTLFLSGSTGARVRLWGGQSAYGYFFYHSPYYRGTMLPSLDRHELTADFGWIMRDRKGREWRFGLSEDLAPGDAGIDLILKVSRTIP